MRKLIMAVLLAAAFAVPAAAQSREISWRWYHLGSGAGIGPDLVIAYVTSDESSVTFVLKNTAKSYGNIWSSLSIDLHREKARDVYIRMECSFNFIVCDKVVLRLKWEEGTPGEKVYVSHELIRSPS